MTTEPKGLTLPELEKRVAAQMIELMERDGLQWTKGWASPIPPQNLASGHIYTGTNIFTTGLWLLFNGKNDPRFATFKQAREMGGNVKKGAKGIPIIYANRIVKEDEAGNKRTIPFAKVRYVFHVDDLEGIEIPPAPHTVLHQHERDQVIEDFVAKTGARVHVGNIAAFYPEADAIEMPPLGSFENTTFYYSTLLHELTHWTGHESRLNRQTLRDYSRDLKVRAKEELIAEIGAVMLGQRLELITEPREDNAAYVQSWIKLLQDKPGEIMAAASTAAKAIAFLETSHKLKEAA